MTCLAHENKFSRNGVGGFHVGSTPELTAVFQSYAKEELLNSSLVNLIPKEKTCSKYHRLIY